MSSSLFAALFSFPISSLRILSYPYDLETGGAPVTEPILRIESLDTPAGGVRLSFATFSGFTYSLQTSTDMETWANLAATAGDGADFQFDHEGLHTDMERFYRVLGAPPAIEFVPVGNAGNAADPEDGDNETPGVQSFGAVNYEYKIGKYEVTNAQYVQFLNAVAATDTNSLYDAAMETDPRSGIVQSGSPGSFAYTVKAYMGNKPVNYVDWYDALRFCNWLHNAQPAGPQDASTTEDGAYTLTGAASVAAGTDPNHGMNGRNAGALFHLPSENEWYKAAFHEPGADANDYWFYPTRSNSAPTKATADLFGNIDDDSENIANYHLGADWNGQNGNVTTVGSGGAGSRSYYGAADMGGNVWEWNEEDILGYRGLRGGGWFVINAGLQSSTRFAHFSPARGFSTVGLRVASP